ncbi:MAG: hypothetical protein LBR53_07295 [Deltaproteobacteria bacterium]|nr:hypothetical protein [Deltaproteobacteria bacterium]
MKHHPAPSPPPRTGSGPEAPRTTRESPSSVRSPQAWFTTTTPATWGEPPDTAALFPGGGPLSNRRLLRPILVPCRSETPKELLAEFLTPLKAFDGKSRPLGFDVLALNKGSLFGQAGYTGTAWWWSPHLD